MNTHGTGKRRASLREEQKRLTRERLLDAALEVFTEVGFRGATMDGIAARAGANRTTCYLHFRDKIDIAAALGRRITTETANHFRELDELEHPDRAQIRGWLRAHMAFLARNRMLSQMLNEAVCTETEFAEEYCAFVGRIADRVMVRTLARCNDDRREIVRSKMILFNFLIGRYVHHVVAQKVKFPGRAPLDALAEMMWNELFAPAAPAAGGPSPAADATDRPAGRRRASRAVRGSRRVRDSGPGGG